MTIIPSNAQSRNGATFSECNKGDRTASPNDLPCESLRNSPALRLPWQLVNTILNQIVTQSIIHPQQANSSFELQEPNIIWPTLNLPGSHSIRLPMFAEPLSIVAAFAVVPVPAPGAVSVVESARRIPGRPARMR